MTRTGRPSRALRALSVAAFGAAAYASFVVLPEARSAEYLAPADGPAAVETLKVEPPRQP